MANRADTPFRVGDTVTVHALNADGRIVEALSPGVYRVAVRSLHITVKETEIAPAVSNASATHLTQSARHREVNVVTKRPERVPHTIDLHGLTVDDACRTLEQWLNAMIVTGAKQGKVIHGLGSGKVQRATHETLSRYSAVRAFRLNDLNPGETDVYLG